LLSPAGFSEFDGEDSLHADAFSMKIFQPAKIQGEREQLHPSPEVGDNIVVNVSIK